MWLSACVEVAAGTTSRRTASRVGALGVLRTKRVVAMASVTTGRVTSVVISTVNPSPFSAKQETLAVDCNSAVNRHSFAPHRDGVCTKVSSLLQENSWFFGRDVNCINFAAFWNTNAKENDFSISK